MRASKASTVGGPYAKRQKRSERGSESLRWVKEGEAKDAVRHLSKFDTFATCSGGAAGPEIDRDDPTNAKITPTYLRKSA